MEVTVADRLAALGETYKVRNKTYSNNYYRHGPLMVALFPEGIELGSPEEHARFGILTMMVSKLSRYAANFKSGGHKDSLDDLAVYSQMLVELDSSTRTLDGVVRK